MELREYLQIAPSYGEPVAGLRWSSSGDAVEHADGSTFALVQQVMRFLEGFAGERPLIHFNHVLHILHILRTGEPAIKPFHQPTRLRHIFQQAKCNYRNAGALCAWLTRDVLCELGVPTLKDLWSEASRQSMAVPDAGPRAGGYSLAPRLTSGAFEDRVFLRIANYSDHELRHWLRFGQRPPDGAGERLANAVEFDPQRSLHSLVSEFAQRERLVGALPYVDHLASALSLPPRELDREPLAQGGYTDVATRGGPETLLPSQFAYEDLDFARRYAEHELLFFRREAPPTRKREEMVVVLDQGVRTWGIVRLVLSSAAIALSRLAERRRLPFRVMSTGAGGGPLDPRQTASAEVAAFLEASDLSANPGMALARVLEDTPEAERDIVLLTHPRSLAEPDVVAAARRLPPNRRLFALAVDDTGRAEFDELRRGGCINLNRFRVALRHDTPIAVKTAENKTSGGWRGDVEPVPFPFRIGIASRHGPFHFAFSVEGDWLLTASRHGLLHATHTADGETHLLPRGMQRGMVLRDPLDVIGVAAGFMVIGALHGELVGFHYDFAGHRCSAHQLFELAGLDPRKQLDWWYLRRLHTIVVSDGNEVRCLHLSTCSRERVPATMVRRPMGIAFHRGSVRPSLSSASLPEPAGPVGQWNNARWFLRALPLQAAGAPQRRDEQWHWPVLRFDTNAGEIALKHVVAAWSPFVPVADGQPMLRGVNVVHGSCQGETLALVVTGRNGKSEPALCVFRGPSGTPVGEYSMPEGQPLVALSADGRLLARTRARNEVELRDVHLGSRPRPGAPVGRFPQSVRVSLGDCSLKIDTRHTHLLFHWSGGKLVIARGADKAGPELMALCDGAKATAAVPAWLGYDSDRFVQSAVGLLTAVVDRFGQVSLFQGGELVAMFFAFRNQAAAWSPDGACCGTAALLGRAATPGAEERIGAALHAACARARGARR